MSELFSKAVDDTEATVDGILLDDELTYAEKCASVQRATIQMALLGIGQALSRIEGKLDK